MKNFSFEEIVASYKNTIFAIAFQYFRNPTDADDIVQEVFLKLYHAQTTHDFESLSHIRNWLIRVTINQCKQIILSGWFSKRLPLEDYAKQLAYEDSQESDLFLAVMNLPQKYRIIVHLYYYENYKIKEIACLLSLKESAISTRLMRARGLLKEKLLEDWANE